MKALIIVLLIVVGVSGYSQKPDTITSIILNPVEVVDDTFQKQYKYLKPKVVKVYPYALYAADVLDQLENDLISIQKRRLRNKKCRISYKNLKKDFKYALQDMYISEGKVLMKLIARETDMSVHEIIKKYRGAKDAAMFNVMGKMFEQDTKVEYSAEDEYVIEFIIREIQEGKLGIANAPKMMSKDEFKAQAKKDKATRKKNKKRHKANKKLKKKNKKALKKKRKSVGEKS